MKIIKKIIATSIALCAAISMTACGDTDWVYDYSGKQITSGMYIAKQMQYFSEVQNHKDYKADVDLLKQKIEGKAVSDYIYDKVKADCDNYMAVENEFDRLGLKLVEKDNNVIAERVKTGWDQAGEIYKKNSVNENTYTKVITNGYKRDMIFSKYYDKGGIEEVKNEDLTVHFKNNFAVINIKAISMEVAETGKELTTEQIATNTKTKENIKKMLDSINKDKKGFNQASADFDVANKKANEEIGTEEIKPDDETRNVMKKGSKSPSEKTENAIFNDAKQGGDAIMIEDTQGIYVVKRVEIEKATKNFDEMRSQLLYDLKGEGFEKKIAELAKAATAPKVNQNSIKRYKLKNIDFTEE